VLDKLHAKHVTANQITISSVILSILIGISFWYADLYRWLFLALPVGLFLRMALNAMDGMMARLYNQQSKLGEVINEIGDVVSDVIIYLPLIKFESNSLYLVVIFICLSIINEMAGVLGKVISNERRYDGPMGKSDRAFVVGLYGLLCFLGIDFMHYSQYIFSILILLVCISTFLRLKRCLQALKS